MAREILRSHPGARVLFMSGYAAEAISPRGLLSGNAPLLLKPFDPAELTEAVPAVLDASARIATGAPAAANGT